jgi:hypothetical protein
VLDCSPPDIRRSITETQYTTGKGQTMATAKKAPAKKAPAKKAAPKKAAKKK